MSNEFGYVEIKDGMVVCYTGDSTNPTVHEFDNPLFVVGQKLLELVKARTNKQKPTFDGLVNEETFKDLQRQFNSTTQTLKSLLEEAQKS